MHQDWIGKALEDLSTFARLNGMPVVADAIHKAALTAQESLRPEGTADSTNKSGEIG